MARSQGSLEGATAVTGRWRSGPSATPPTQTPAHPPYDLALPAYGLGPKGKDMAHAVVRRPVEEGERGAEEAAPDLALPAHGQGPKERDMTHAALRTYRDAGHGGMKRAPGLAGRDPSEGGGPVVDPIQASAADAPGSAGEAGGPRRTPNLMVPCK